MKTLSSFSTLRCLARTPKFLHASNQGSQSSDAAAPFVAPTGPWTMCNEYDLKRFLKAASALKFGPSFGKPSAEFTLTCALSRSGSLCKGRKRCSAVTLSAIEEMSQRTLKRCSWCSAVFSAKKFWTPKYLVHSEFLKP